MKTKLFNLDRVDIDVIERQVASGTFLLAARHRYSDNDYEKVWAKLICTGVEDDG